jgi:pentatricopeptide repeat protein
MSNTKSSLSLLVLMIVPVVVNGWIGSNFKDIKFDNRNHGGKVVFSNEKSPYTHSCPSSSSSSTLFATPVKEEEDNVIEYLDLDDDDEDDDEENDNEDSGLNYSPKEALAKQTEWMKQLRQLTHTTSVDTSAVSVAEGIFDDMFRTYIESDDSTFWPTVEVYNRLLEIHAYSKSKNGGDEAEKILDRMMKDATSNDSFIIPPPNQQTYLCVMDAWAMRGQPEKVQRVLDRQKEYSMNDDDDDDDDNYIENLLLLRPTADSYNKLIKAYGIAGDLEQAESTFRSLLDDEESDSSIPMANHKSWVQIMKSYASSRDENNEEMVQSLFDEMLSGEEEYLPQTGVYNVLIRSIGKKKDGPQKAEAMLFDMIERFRKGEVEVKPNSETFRSVLSAYNGRGPKFTAASVAAKVEQILQIREGILATSDVIDSDEESDDDSDSDERLYRMALGIVGRSKDPKKAVRAKRIFGKYTGPLLSNRLHYHLLMSCAFTDGDSEVKFDAFQTALGVMKELRSSSELEIDSAITGMFIKACNNLMPEGSKRDDLVKKIFQDCCRQGLVNEFVLGEFGKAASESLQLEILGGYSVDDISIPKSWSDNIVA